MRPGSGRADASCATPGRGAGSPAASGPIFADHDEARRRARRARRRAAPATARDALGVGGRADPEDDRAARPHERQAPLGRRRRRRERLRDRDAGPVGLLLLGAAPDDARVRRRPRARGTRTSAARPRAARPRAPAARARAGSRARRRPSRRRRSARRSARTSGSRAQRVVEQHAPRLVEIAERGQARASRATASSQASSVEAGQDDDEAIRLRPLARVSTPATSFSRSCTTLRSTAVIGSSSTRSPSQRALGCAQRDRPRASRGAARGSRRRRPSPASPSPRAVHDRVRDVLQRVDRLAVLADQQSRGRRRRTRR